MTRPRRAHTEHEAPHCARSPADEAGGQRAGGPPRAGPTVPRVARAAAPGGFPPGVSAGAVAETGEAAGSRPRGSRTVAGVLATVVVAAAAAALLPVPIVTALLFAVGGGASGVLARVALARMRRGARVRAPVCELVLAGLWAATGTAWLGGALPGAWVPVLLGLAWLLVAGSVVDVLHQRLPDALTVPALPGALLLVLPLGPAAAGRAAGGAAVALAVHAGVHLVAPRALGAGDVKLAGALGAVLAAVSWPALALAGMLAALLSALLAAALVAAGRGRAGALPHGPSMLLATWLVVAGAALGAGAG